MKDATAIELRESAQPKWLVMLLSWLVPGYGYYVNGLQRRALLAFFVIELTFAIGCVLRGGVFLPEFRWTHEGFNIVSLLTFFTQMFNGGAALLSLLPELLGAKWAILPYDESYCWADLGSFYILVAGGLNYFLLTSTYDHFYGRKRAEAHDQSDEDES